jgi:hypothetical protein
MWMLLLEHVAGSPAAMFGRLCQRCCFQQVYLNMHPIAKLLTSTSIRIWGPAGVLSHRYRLLEGKRKALLLLHVL